jgi:hypothetical protein
MALSFRDHYNQPCHICVSCILPYILIFLALYFQISSPKASGHLGWWRISLTAAATSQAASSVKEQQPNVQIHRPSPITVKQKGSWYMAANLDDLGNHAWSFGDRFGLGSASSSSQTCKSTNQRGPSGGRGGVARLVVRGVIAKLVRTW